MDDAKPPECQICYESLLQGAVQALCCGHAFHDACLQLGIESGTVGFEDPTNIRCPDCRQGRMKYDDPIHEVWVLIHSGLHGDLLLESTDQWAWCLPHDHVRPGEIAESTARRLIRDQLGIHYGLFGSNTAVAVIQDADCACFVYPPIPLPMPWVYETTCQSENYPNHFVYRAKWSTIDQPAVVAGRLQWCIIGFQIVRNAWLQLHQKFGWPYMWEDRHGT